MITPPGAEMPEVITNTIVKASFDPINQCMYTVQAETLTKTAYVIQLQRIKFDEMNACGLTPHFATYCKLYLLYCGTFSHGTSPSHIA